MPDSARAYLVESIPKGLEDLRGTPGVAIHRRRAGPADHAAKSSIDLTAMYWALLADPGSDDEKGFTPEQLDTMGAGTGRALYEALRAAAQRGVRIRILQSPGFSGPRQESGRAASGLSRPDLDPLGRDGQVVRRRRHHAPEDLDLRSAPHLPRLGQHGLEVDHAGQGNGRGRRGLPGSRRGRRQVLRGLVGFRCPFADERRRCSTRWRASIGACRHGRSSCRRSSAHIAAGRREVCDRLQRKAPLSSTLGGEEGAVFLTGCPHEVRGPAGPGTRKGWSTPSTTRASRSA